MITSGIYLIQNILNGKVYIGKSSDVKKRIRYHFKHYNKHKFYFYSALQKYSPENFIFRILEIGNFSNKELSELEKSYVWLYNSNNDKYGYNLTIGGEGTKGLIKSEETRKKHSEIVKSRPSGMLGKKHSEKTLIKMSQSAKNKLPMSLETKEKIKQVNLGKKLSEETKKKKSESMKGRICIYNEKLNIYKKISNNDLQNYLSNGYVLGSKPFTKERKDHMSKIMIGKKHTEAQSHKGSIWINNGFKRKRISNLDNLQYYIENGWKKGTKLC